MSLLKIHSFAAVRATKLKCLLENHIARLLHTQECFSHSPFVMADANKMTAVHRHEACATCDLDFMRGIHGTTRSVCIWFLALSIHTVVTKTPRESNLLHKKDGRQLPRNQLIDFSPTFYLDQGDSRGKLFCRKVLGNSRRILLWISSRPNRSPE